MKRVFIECTYVFDHPEVNSGIQRVVKNIIRELPRVESNKFEYTPAVIKNNQLYSIKKMYTVDDRLSLNQKIKRNLTKVRNHYWLYHCKLESYFPFTKSLNCRRGLYLLAKLGALALSFALSLVSRPIVENDFLIAVEAEAGDTIILLDASWNDDFYTFLDAYKQRGVYIVTVIYDLIPITNREFFDDQLVAMFNNWFKWISNNSDGYIAISKTVAAQFSGMLASQELRVCADPYWVDSFYLGSDFHRHKDGLVRPVVAEVFENESDVYLTVSTIEPRKNHAFIIDVFELLWGNGVDLSLCIVGKVGWKTEELIKRIKSHAEFNKRLFMFNDIDDSELEYCYQNSKALVFASMAEGFGLPLVEAAQRGLPVICSNIPVFSEVGGDNFYYFELGSRQSLNEAILNFRSKTTNSSVGNVKWLSWLESTQQLIDVVDKNIIK
jgi:glycosyltransferase involved in cell wall biosynthesis